MTRLELLRRYARDIRMTTIPTTTIITPGTTPRDWERGINYIDEAWQDIQTLYPDWDWMLSSKALGAGASFPTVASQHTYELGIGAGKIGIAEDSFRKWKDGTFRLYITSVGTNDEQHLGQMSFEAWRNGWLFNANRNVAYRPVSIAIGPDASLNLGPAPNATGYTVTGDYWIQPTAMTGDSSTPTGLPLQFHLAIMYGAMMKYGATAPAPEAYQNGEKNYRRMMNQLGLDKRPRMRMAGPLA